jgi:hypothetical protein
VRCPARQSVNLGDRSPPSVSPWPGSVRVDATASSNAESVTPVHTWAHGATYAHTPIAWRQTFVPSKKSNRRHFHAGEMRRATAFALKGQPRNVDVYGADCCCGYWARDCSSPAPITVAANKSAARAPSSQREGGALLPGAAQTDRADANLQSSPSGTRGQPRHADFPLVGFFDDGGCRR